MGIIAFFFTLIRFFQDYRRISVDHTIHPEKLFETIYDDRDNPIGEKFVQDHSSIELKIKNRSSRPVSILSIRHDSDFRT